MHILLTRFRSGEELVERYEESFLYGGIFYPTRQIIEVGEIVILDVRLPNLRDYLLIRGMVAWHRRGKRSENIRAGLGIEFLVSEQSKRDYLLSLAHGEPSVSSQRRHRRLPIELRVDWRVPNEASRHLSLVDDISAGGAFLRTSQAPALGTPLLLDLSLPGSSVPQTLEARVAWRRQTPGSEGVGVEFRCRDIAGMRRLRELVKRIESHTARP